MAFNTRPSTINEVAGFVEKRLTNARNQLRQMNENDPNYEYVQNRIIELENHAAKIRAMVGKKLPESPRDQWKKKLDKR